MTTDTVELKNRVRRILLESPFAILCTVGDDSRPFCRWMTPIFATGSLAEFHTLAAPHSRKIAQIRKNPRVTWVFTTLGFEDIVTLHGTASVEDDPLLRTEIWERMPDKQRSFILKNDENLQFLIIRTEVETLEYVRPRLGETTPAIFTP